MKDKQLLFIILYNCCQPSQRSVLLSGAAHTAREGVLASGSPDENLALVWRDIGSLALDELGRLELLQWGLRTVRVNVIHTRTSVD